MRSCEEEAFARRMKVSVNENAFRIPAYLRRRYAALGVKCNGPVLVKKLQRPLGPLDVPTPNLFCGLRFAPLKSGTKMVQ